MVTFERGKIRYGYGSKMIQMLADAIDFSRIVSGPARKRSLSGNKWVSDVRMGHAAFRH